MIWKTIQLGSFTIFLKTKIVWNRSWERIPGEEARKVSSGSLKTDPVFHPKARLKMPRNVEEEILIEILKSEGSLALCSKELRRATRLQVALLIWFFFDHSSSYFSISHILTAWQEGGAYHWDSKEQKHVPGKCKTDLSHRLVYPYPFLLS